MPCYSAKWDTDAKPPTLKGKLVGGYAIPHPHVVVQDEASMLIPTGLTTVTVRHVEQGYGCWLINLSEYRRSNDFYVHIKSVGENTAELDIVNTGQPFTGSFGSTIWLCYAK